MNAPFFLTGIHRAKFVGLMIAAMLAAGTNLKAQLCTWHQQVEAATAAVEYWTMICQWDSEAVTYKQNDVDGATVNVNATIARLAAGEAAGMAAAQAYADALDLVVDKQAELEAAITAQDAALAARNAAQADKDAADNELMSAAMSLSSASPEEYAYYEAQYQIKSDALNLAVGVLAAKQAALDAAVQAVSDASTAKVAAEAAVPVRSAELDIALAEIESLENQDLGSHQDLAARQLLLDAAIAQLQSSLFTLENAVADLDLLLNNPNCTCPP